jgi:hypothetical protein
LDLNSVRISIQLLAIIYLRYIGHIQKNDTVLKVNNNLFRTSHGHNKLHQQRKLLMLTAGPRGPVSKMASEQQKAFCVLRFGVFISVITVQREFRARFKTDAPHKSNVARWYRQFVGTGRLCPGRPCVSGDNIEFLF